MKPRMRIVCPIPCSTVPPAEGARARGDAEGGRVAQDGRRRRVRRRQVRPLPALPLGPPRKADHLHRRQGKLLSRNEWLGCVISGTLEPGENMQPSLILTQLAVFTLKPNVKRNSSINQLTNNK